MVTVRIFELRFGMYKIIRKAEVPEELLPQIVTYIYTRGIGKEVSPNEFKIISPMLTVAVKDLEKMLKIQFVEEKPEAY